LFQFFATNLQDLFKADDILNNAECLKFLDETKELFHLLVALAKYPKNHQHEHERCFAFNQLMDYLKQMHREESYSRYAHRMSCELKSLGLNIEAGTALLLHANLLTFNEHKVLPEFKVDYEIIFKEQAEEKRKETLLNQAIAFFDEAKYYEGSLELCNQLYKHYSEDVYKYQEVAVILKKMANYYEQIGERSAITLTLSH